MALGIAQTERHSILNAYCKGTSYAGNLAFWVKLHTADPGAAGTTAAATNTTRVQVTWGTPATGVIANITTALSWTSVPAAETYSHLSFWTASTAGTFIGNAALTTPRTVAIGDNFTIAVGSLTVSTTGA